MIKLISKKAVKQKKEKQDKTFFRKLSGAENKEKTKNYFSANYDEAREKFRTLASKMKMDAWSKALRKNNSVGLTVDFAYNNPGSDKLLIINSGVHGVEGYTGSAVQLLFLDKVYNKYKDKFAILLIHSYNPYGFKNNRRVNENNVDLNRNCVDDYNTIMTDKKIKQIVHSRRAVFSPEKPRKIGIIEESKYSLAIAKTLLRHGVENTINAGSFGQNIYPKGVSYAGTCEEESTGIFKEVIAKYTPQFKKVFFIDLHTGIGRRNFLSLFTDVQKDSQEFLFLKQTLKNIKSRKFSRVKGLKHRGSVTEYFMANSKAQQNFDLLVEFGTVSRISGALSLASLSRINLEENQITHFGPKNKLEKARQKLKEAYYPNTIIYKILVLNKSERMLDKICRGLSS